MQDDQCNKDDHVHGQGPPDDAGKPGAEKSARRVWREAFGTGQQCTSPGAYPTSMELRLPHSSLVQVGGRQERFFCRLGFQGTTAMAPSVAWRKSDELKAPIGGIQANDARAKVIEADGQFQSATSKGSIMTVGWGDQEMHGQTGAATKQGMLAIAMQEGTGIVGRSMTSGGIGISFAPSQNGRDRCLFVTNGRHHRLTPLTRELTSSGVRLPYFLTVRKCLLLWYNKTNHHVRG